MMKNILFWIIVVCSGTIIVYFTPKDEATRVIATFTIVLAAATIWNIGITQGLLRQSRQTSEMDTFNKMISSTLQLNAALRAANFSTRERPLYIQNCAVGMLLALKDIDPIAFEKVGKVIEAWNKKYKIRAYEHPSNTFLVALTKVRGKERTQQ